MARAAFDFRLRHEAPTAIDRARFDLWLAQVAVDAAAGADAELRGDSLTLGWVWDRIAVTFSASEAAAIEADLADLATATAAEDATQAAAIATQIRTSMTGTGWR